MFLLSRQWQIAIQNKAVPHTHTLREPLRGSYLYCVMLWSQPRRKSRQPPPSQNSPTLLLAHIYSELEWEEERRKLRKGKKDRKCPGGQGKTTKQKQQLGAHRLPHTPVSWKTAGDKTWCKFLKRVRCTENFAFQVKMTKKKREKNEKKKQKNKTRFHGFANFRKRHCRLAWTPATPSFKISLVVSDCQVENYQHLMFA